MSFLLSLSRDRERKTSLKEDDGENEEASEDRSPQQACLEQTLELDDEASSLNSTAFQQEPPTRKRRIQQKKTSLSSALMKYLVEREKEEQQADPIDTFFSLMATSVKKFNPTDQHYIKTKVFSLVNETELKYLPNVKEEALEGPAYASPLPPVSPPESKYSTTSSAYDYSM